MTQHIPVHDNIGSNPSPHHEPGPHPPHSPQNSDIAPHVPAPSTSSDPIADSYGVAAAGPAAVTDGAPRAARAKTRVRTYQPWMPGQGNRAWYGDIVFATREDAETYMDCTGPKLGPGWWQQLLDDAQER